MNKKIIVLVLDGLGIGAMEDVIKVRQQDINSNTLRSVLESYPEEKLYNLEKLGLANAYGSNVGSMKKSNTANYGTISLLHSGADTFYGHQEMMGSYPREPKKNNFMECIDNIHKSLTMEGYDVKYIGNKINKILLVNNCVAIGDNLEADQGRAFNVTASFDYIDYSEVIKIGKIVREHVKVSRVIAFGGKDVDLYHILSAIEEKDGTAIGINAPKSGVYNSGYEVLHMGYGIDSSVQAPFIIGEAGLEVVLIGKVADIVENPYGISIPSVDTEQVMEILLTQIRDGNSNFICANVQETDLAGHSQNAKKYMEKLKIVDEYLEKIIPILSSEDILFVVADHGNDPLIGHCNHTREKVPLLMYRKGVEGTWLGDRKTLSDIGATVCSYLGVDKNTENGESILK